MNQLDLEYAGFWIRVGATIVDTILIVIVTLPLLVAIYGWSHFASDQFIAGPADLLIS